MCIDITRRITTKRARLAYKVVRVERAGMNCDGAPRFYSQYHPVSRAVQALPVLAPLPYERGHVVEYVPGAEAHAISGPGIYVYATLGAARAIYESYQGTDRLTYAVLRVRIPARSRVWYGVNPFTGGRCLIAPRVKVAAVVLSCF